MALGLLSGRPESVKPLADLYWQSAREAGHDLSKLRVSVTGHAYIAQTGEQAINEFVPHYNQYFGYFLQERGQHFRTTAEQLMPQRAAGQILAVGSAEELAEKILYQHELFGHSRFMGQFDMGGQPLVRRVMVILTFVLQGILALMFLMAGFGKVTGSKMHVEGFKH